MKGEISINGFSGMNNVKIDENLYSSNGIAEPRIILNADVDITQMVNKREGTTKLISLPGSHSLWGGISCMLCVSNGGLYRLNPPDYKFICSIDDRGERVDYVEIDGRV
jgi:hypothetical protein